MPRPLRPFFACLLTVASLFAADPLSPAENAILQSISASTLQSHVSFLASDLLEGRDTPSRGLDIAAEYIAAQFRRSGLKPAGDQGYFQSAPYLRVKQPMDAFELSLTTAGTAYKPALEKVMVAAESGLTLRDAAPVKVVLTDENSPLPARDEVAGKAVLLLPGTLRGRALMLKREALLDLNPSVILTSGFTFQMRERLRPAALSSAKRAPVVTINDPQFQQAAESLDASSRLSLSIQAPAEEPVPLKNVIGILEGSDPQLAKSYLLLTAHYDHTGVNPRGDGDRINNGANDDASGVATILALAEAFSKSPQRPKRTLVFIAYFGEEKGLLGSRFYSQHPVFPLAQTVANLNFEHMGRTDDNEGSRAGKITATGFDYSTLGQSLTEAGQLTGVEAWKHERNSDSFFNSSDNQPLAEAGVPAITVAVSWIFPDYHRPGDHWDKIDYPNMQQAVRTAALTAARVANSNTPPAWIDSHPKVVNYLKAWRALHP